MVWTVAAKLAPEVGLEVALYADASTDNESAPSLRTAEIFLAAFPSFHTLHCQIRRAGRSKLNYALTSMKFDDVTQNSPLNLRVSSLFFGSTNNNQIVPGPVYHAA